MLVELLRGKGRKAAVMFKGVFLACAVTVVMLLVLAFIMLKLQATSEKMELFILVTYVISCFVGGIYCGRQAEKRKFLYGMLLGTTYFILLFFLSAMGDRDVQSGILKSAVAFCLCACGGMLGGMVAG